MSTRITEAMVEAMTEVAIDGPGYVSFYPSLHDCRRLLEAALSAEPGEAEEKPIAWLRPRDIARLSETSPGAINAQIANASFERWTVPVYAAPLPEDTHHG